ncbi:MAG: hypothetical protein E6J87_12260 [Deltaproteobacteria bacterium]|nr:MAG: hypothetical protein E6J87_12260 [Deltaproteobacteria bacterium]
MLPHIADPREHLGDQTLEVARIGHRHHHERTPAVAREQIDRADRRAQVDADQVRLRVAVDREIGLEQRGLLHHERAHLRRGEMEHGRAGLGLELAAARAQLHGRIALELLHGLGQRRLREHVHLTEIDLAAGELVARCVGLGWAASP